jgi:hypothetical protein
MEKYLLIFTLIVSLLCSCATIQNNAKYELSNGNYKLKIEGKKYHSYIENKEDTILVHNLNSKISTALPQSIINGISKKQHLIKPSLDIDILTALFKIRPKIENELPTQLNTNFNGNLFIGRRTDIYQIQYIINPLNNFIRQINHFGFSGGVFVGLGNTAMNPSTTQNRILTEYDGLIFQKGVAGIIAVNKLTIGLSIGLDNLLDQNKKLWIYEDKPWFGLMLGLNLN